MRWRRMTFDEKQAAHLKKLRTWQRKFAWRPHHDGYSHMVYWLEFVWVRWIDMDKDGRAPWVKEVRGGNSCPELKLPPVTPLPDAALPTGNLHE